MCRLCRKINWSFDVVLCFFMYEVRNYGTPLVNEKFYRSIWTCQLTFNKEKWLFPCYIIYPGAFQLKAAGWHLLNFTYKICVCLVCFPIYFHCNLGTVFYVTHFHTKMLAEITKTRTRSRCGNRCIATDWICLAGCDFVLSK